MKLTTQTQRAVMAMMALALNSSNRVSRLGALAKQQGISLSYMEQLIHNLRHAGLVEGIRGPGGGYRLSKPAAQISIADILQAVESEGVAETDIGNADIPATGSETVLNLLTELDDQILGFLSGISLASLTAPHKKSERKFKPGKTALAIARMFPTRGSAGMPSPAGA